MLTDALSKGGLNVPKLEGELAEELKAQLFPGASVGNPIDILATGTPDHLRICIDYCEEKLDNIDAILAIFGTPGLVTMFEMYDVLHEKMQTCRKPIFPVLPSINTAGAEVAAFLAKGHVNFSDEVTLGTALSALSTPRNPRCLKLNCSESMYRESVVSLIPSRRMDISNLIMYRHCCTQPVFHWSMNLFPIKRRKLWLLPVDVDSR